MLDLTGLNSKMEGAPRAPLIFIPENIFVLYNEISDNYKKKISKNKSLEMYQKFGTPDFFLKWSVSSL